jgi:hypothetical protein
LGVSYPSAPTLLRTHSAKSSSVSELAARLRKIRSVSSGSATIRQAIDSQIKERRHDAAFQKRLRVAMARNQKALELLAK